MKQLAKLILPIYLLAGICLTGSISNSSQADTDLSIEIPVFQGGYDIKRESNPSAGTQSITYRVGIAYPAAEIIEFYDSYFNGRGWISSFEICQRHWAESDDKPKYSGLAARQMFVSWQHPALNLKLVLWLKHGLADHQRPDEVLVEGRLQTMSDN
jgi:hypothetical protein